MAAPGVTVDTGQDESVIRRRASVEERAASAQPLRVALLGCGVVGSAVARLLTEHADDLAARVGAPLELVGIAVRRAGTRPLRDRPSTRRCSPPTPRRSSPGPTSSSR